MIISTIGMEFQGFFTGKGNPYKVTFQAIGGRCYVRMFFENHIHERLIDATISEEGVWNFHPDSPFIKSLIKCKKNDEVVVISDGLTVVTTTVGTSKTRCLADSGEMWNPWETLQEIGYVEEGDRIAKLMTFVRTAATPKSKLSPDSLTELTITRRQGEKGLKIFGVCKIGIGIVEGVTKCVSDEIIGIDCNGIKLQSKMGLTHLLANDKYLSLRCGADTIHIKRKTESPRVSPDGVKAIFDNAGESTIVERVGNGALKKALKMALSYVPKRHQYARVMYNPDYDEFGIFTEPTFDSAIEWNGQPCNCVEWGMMDSVSVNIPATMRILDGLGEELTIKYTESRVVFLSDQSQDFVIIGEIE